MSYLSSQTFSVREHKLPDPWSSDRNRPFPHKRPPNCGRSWKKSRIDEKQSNQLADEEEKRIFWQKHWFSGFFHKILRFRTRWLSLKKANRMSGSLASSLARCSRPRVQAKMLAMGLVLVLRPFWCSRKWRVTVPCAASASIVLPSGQTSTLVIRPSEPKPYSFQDYYPFEKFMQPGKLILEKSMQKTVFKDYFRTPWATMSDWTSPS